MIRRFYLYYIDSFRGLRAEVWWLALVTLINRAGTMVFPFLSLYLNESLEFGFREIGWIMSAFGAGSVVGALLGGRLSDKLGFYPVVFLSLVVSGVLFIGLQYVHSFVGLLIYTFLLLAIADTLRPAVYVAVNTYSKPENRTRSVTLIRLAINLGFSLGPALGGVIIAVLGYNSIFWLDGLTCILAGFLFLLLLNRKKAASDSKNMRMSTGRSPYHDFSYMLFLFVVFLIGFTFLQLFSTIPLYYRNVYHLSEASIGLLMASNGILIFLLEMPSIKFIEKHIPLLRILLISTLILSASFIVLNLAGWKGVLVISMFLLTVGEMLNFPFLNRFALDRGHGAHAGDYMALFTMSFSLGHIFGPNIGMQLTEAFGFSVTWYVMAAILLFAFGLIMYLKKRISLEKSVG